MKPQLRALANSVRQRKGPPPPGQQDNWDPLLTELKGDLLDITIEDRDVLEEFSVTFLQATADIKKGIE